MSNQTQFFPARLAVTALAGLLGAGFASADSLDTWNLYAGRSVARDDNLFRLSDSANTQQLLGTNQRSDTITTDTLGLKINKPYSLQRFEIDLNLAKYSYRTFDYLDFTARNYAAAWRWSATPSFTGNLIASRQESLNNFFDTQNYLTRNIRTDDRQRFDGDLDLGSGWHLIAGVFRTVRKNSEAFSQERDNTLNSSELGGRYDFTSGSSIGFLNRIGRGTYDNQPQPQPATLRDNAFDQTENLLLFSWPVTVKTNVNARIGYLSRTHDNYAVRDYSGTVGALSVNWEISGKSHLSAGLTRNLISYESNSSSYSTVDRFYFSPVWQITSKVGLRFRYDYIKQDYLGPVVPNAGPVRNDNERISLLAVDWKPLSFVSVTASVADDRRSSNEFGRDFKDTIALISLQLMY